jgi:hypothetical protein
MKLRKQLELFCYFIEFEMQNFMVSKLNERGSIAIFQFLQTKKLSLLRFLILSQTAIDGINTQDTSNQRMKTKDKVFLIFLLSFLILIFGRHAG